MTGESYLLSMGYKVVINQKQTIILYCDSLTHATRAYSTELIIECAQKLLAIIVCDGVVEFFFSWMIDMDHGC